MFAIEQGILAVLAIIGEDFPVLPRLAYKQSVQPTVHALGTPHCS